MEEASDLALAEALGVAREHFESNDPRLGASLIAYACVLERAGDEAASALREEGYAVWRAARSWVETMKPERRSRSATYHLRLERRYEGQYDRFSQCRYLELYEEGLGWAKDGLAGQALQDSRARWTKEKPAGFNDVRRLLAAVCLMPPRP